MRPPMSNDTSSHKSGKTLANYTRHDLLRAAPVITERCHMKLRTYEFGNF